MVKKIVKNLEKHRLGAASESVSDAAAVLGVSIPTIRRMVKEGMLAGFNTPGGQLRIFAESIEAVKERPQASPRGVRGPSLVLQNRRESVEEVTLETQELRAKQELRNLRREEQEERLRREDEAQARNEEAAERQAQLDLERKRFNFEKAQQRVSQQREQAEQRRKAEELRELAAFRLRWHGKATENLSAHTYQWLSAQQRKEVLDGLEAEIDKRQPLDEPRMGAIIARSLAALVEPLQAVHDAQEARQRVTNQVLRSLSIWTSEAEKVRATVAIEEALQRFDTFADVCKIRVVLEEAVAPVRLATEKRRAEEERKARKGSLIQRGLDEVFFFLAHLKSAGEIVEEALWDTEFMESLKETVRRRLEADLSGDEPLREVKELVHEVIEEVLEADEEDE